MLKSKETPELLLSRACQYVWSILIFSSLVREDKLKEETGRENEYIERVQIILMQISMDSK